MASGDRPETWSEGQGGHRARAFAFLSLVGILTAAAACGGEPSSGPPGLADPSPPCNALRWNEPPRKRNVVLIVSDTMRRDRVGIYGGSAGTPVFDGFARRNLYFTQAYTQAPWTKPSITTLFTGLYPSQHRVGQEHLVAGGLVETDVLGDDLVTLAEAMLEAGYRTAAVVSNPWLKKEFGFGQGFEVYDDSFASTAAEGHRVSTAAIELLRELPEGEPYFFYVHYMDSHGPYGPLSRAQVSERAEEIAADRRPLTHERAALKWIEAGALFEDGSSVLEAGVPPTRTLMEMIYDGGVESFDRALGELLDGLSVRPDFEETAVIVTSDHGEALFTRGWGNHGKGLFDDEIAVPLAVRFPGISGPNSVECPVGLIDVMSTLSIYLGLESPGENNFGVSFIGPHPGRSWFSKSPDDRVPRYLVSEGVVGKPRHRLIRNRSFKLMFEPEGRSWTASQPDFALFEIAADGNEDYDLLSPDNRRPEIESVLSKLSAALEAAVPAVEIEAVEKAPLDEETQRRLEALGYLE